jgi:hypothetical protein
MLRCGIAVMPIVLLRHRRTFDHLERTNERGDAQDVTEEYAEGKRLTYRQADSASLPA